MHICLGLPCECVSYINKEFVGDILCVFYEESLGGVPGEGGVPAGERLRGKRDWS